MSEILKQALKLLNSDCLFLQFQFWTCEGYASKQSAEKALETAARINSQNVHATTWRQSVYSRETILVNKNHIRKIEPSTLVPSLYRISYNCNAHHSRWESSLVETISKESVEVLTIILENGQTMQGRFIMGQTKSKPARVSKK